MKLFKHAMTLGLLAIIAVGCNQEKVLIDPLAGGGGLGGEWVSGDNIFTAQFVNGYFLAVANDTGAKLSEGSYVVISASEVQLKWLGFVSKQENSAVCDRPNPALINCTDQTGKVFSLVKKEMASQS